MDRLTEVKIKHGRVRKYLRENHYDGVLLTSDAIGYEAREYIGISESKEVVGNPQAFAWNPSIHGNKSEDSIIVSNAGQEVITMTGDWPVIEVNYDGMVFKRPAILEI